MPAHESISLHLAGWFAEATLVASALALVAHLVDRRRGASPAVRHALWLVVLIKLMMPPLVHWPWSRQLGILAPPRVAGASVEARPEAASSPTPREAPPSDELANFPGPAEPTVLAAFLPDDEGEREADAFDAPDVARPEVPPISWATWPTPGRWLFSAWLAGSALVGVVQVGRIVRFRGRLRHASDAPKWLVGEAEAIGERLSVKVPPIKVVDRLATPVLWCLGRPVLLVPRGLLKTLEAGRWRGILAHELAHLRRGDPWVGRLELLALHAWWWNPLYWLARRRIDFEAELACDAWALWAFPDDRIDYADSLVRICTAPRPARLPSPALGVAGTGQSFERRLIMILRERISHRASLPGLLAAALLAAVAVPSWTLAAATPEPVAPIAPMTVSDVVASDDDRSADDDRDDDDDAPPKAKAKKPKDVKADREDRDEDMDKHEDEAAGPDFEKAMDALGEKIGKEVEERFGPEFEKKMEALGKEIEAKFGPGSEFEKKMEAFGKEMEGKFGPGSDFAKEMEQLGEKIAKEFEFNFEKDGKDPARAGSKADAVKQKADAAKGRAEAAKGRADAAKGRAEASRPRGDRSPSPAKVKGDEGRRDRRIEMLEEQIKVMMKELKDLKGQGDEEEGQD